MTIALGAAAATIYSERHVVVRGVVVTHRTIPARMYGAREFTSDRRAFIPDRRVLAIRVDAGPARDYDVPLPFWNEVHDGDRVERGEGVWRIERSLR